MSKVVCGCGYVICKIHDGKDVEYLGECYHCAISKGEYTKSPHYDKSKDDEDRNRVVNGQAYLESIKGVTPFKDTKQGKKAKRHYK